MRALKALRFGLFLLLISTVFAGAETKTSVDLVWNDAALRGALLSPRAQTLIDRSRESGEVPAVSSVSLWEIALLDVKGRLSLTHPVDRVLARIEATLTLLPINAAIALRAANLRPRYQPIPWIASSAQPPSSTA